MNIRRFSFAALKVVLALAFLNCLTLSPVHWALSQSANAKDSSFLPTWKLMSDQEKQHFVSGYIQGWLDARKVTEIALDYIKDNPQRAIESLESIRKLYDVSLLKPDMLVQHIDRFYENSDNHSASLSMAVTAARSAVK